MNKLLTLALSLPLLACVVGSSGDTAAPGTGGGTGGTGGGTADGKDHIKTPTTWSSTMSISKETVVDPGVTLTIAAGTVVKFAPSTGIEVQGTVDVQGTKASPVQLSPSAAGGHHYGFSVSGAGELKMAYGVQAGGGISVDGGKVTVTDTRMSQAQGDFLVISGGTVDVSYSAIGLEPGAGTDTTHCDMHFGGSGATISITHSNISTSSYGLMLYGGNNVKLTSNNWFGNSIQIDTSAGVSGDVSGGWFDKGAPSATGNGGATLTVTPLATARLTDAGPRP
ncbi:MAG TPA: hypothetical protein VF469_37910 [Kofleriaceae bacterium]